MLSASTMIGALTFRMLGKNFSRRYFEIFFLFFPRKQDLSFYANCIRNGDNLHNVSNPVSWKNIINLSSAELAQRVVMVKQRKPKKKKNVIGHRSTPGKTTWPSVSRTWLSRMWSERGSNHSGSPIKKATGPAVKAYTVIVRLREKNLTLLDTALVLTNLR